MTKLQITLSDQETNLLRQKAMALGYDVTKYAKFVLAREAEEVLTSPPVYSASPKMEKLIGKALEEDKQGKTKKW